MEKEIMKDLEARFLEACGSITIGDSDSTRQLQFIKIKDMPLENIIIATYNLIKVNQVRIERLETNLDILAERVFDTTDNFTEEEIEELKESFFAMDLEDIAKVKSDKWYIYDGLFCREDNFDVMKTKADTLINKVLYPNKEMYDTFNKLVAEAILMKTKKQEEF